MALIKQLHQRGLHPGAFFRRRDICNRQRQQLFAAITEQCTDLVIDIDIAAIRFGHEYGVGRIVQDFVKLGIGLCRCQPGQLRLAPANE